MASRTHNHHFLAHMFIFSALAFVVLLLFKTKKNTPNVTNS